MDEAYNAYQSGLRHFAKDQEHAMAHHTALMVKHHTALAAHLPDPKARASKRMFIAAVAKGNFYAHLVEAANQITSPVYELKCDKGNVPQVQLKIDEFTDLSADPCGGVPTGIKLKSKVPSKAIWLDGYGLSFGESCQKLEVELSASVGVGLFAATHLDWKGTGTLFFGIKGELKTPKVGPLGGSATAKESIYIKFSRNGIVDAGLRVEAKGTAALGQDAVNGLWEAKFEQEVSLQPWTTGHSASSSRA
ncbi:hypothetical protein GCM10008955_40800 [Deinococcus malanensis]|uniref:Uncharacterized protein n=1 Tax=Deinococcus malanensis TaxID=1706855 RepID=A0ABQ2F222_9DEIO|nr:hypothetical protein [Deinococcus malanensis]GGK42850.1 hypothetical protein GCM10008955_40800 [Deinococcus malanensis]